MLFDRHRVRVDFDARGSQHLLKVHSWVWLAEGAIILGTMIIWRRLNLPVPQIVTSGVGLWLLLFLFLSVEALAKRAWWHRSGRQQTLDLMAAGRPAIESFAIANSLRIRPLWIYLLMAFLLGVCGTVWVKWLGIVGFPLATIVFTYSLAIYQRRPDTSQIEEVRYGDLVLLDEKRLPLEFTFSMIAEFSIYPLFLYPMIGFSWAIFMSGILCIAAIFFRQIIRRRDGKPAPTAEQRIEGMLTRLLAD